MRAHVCDGCGCDLSRRRGAYDAALAARVLRCNSCGRTHARRRDPVRAFLTAAFRLDAMLLRLLIQLWLAAGFTLAILSTMMLSAGAVRAGGVSAPRSVATTAFVVLGVALPIALGAWLTAGFAHLPRFRVWAAWTAWIIACGLIALAISSISILLDPAHPMPAAERIALQLFESAPAALALFAVMLIACGGIPIGLQLLRATERFRAWRWRTRRKWRRGALFSQ